jgi:CMP-2-keto-3-deoxyoctulosonic acid synthetase
MNYYSNMCRYDTRGRRLAIFGRQLEDSPDKMEIFILTCSKKDQFSRKVANGIYKLSQNATIVNYQGLKPHPEVFTINIHNVATPKKEFINYVNANYYRIMHEEFHTRGNIINLVVNKNGGKFFSRRRNITVKYLGK